MVMMLTKLKLFKIARKAKKCDHMNWVSTWRLFLLVYDLFKTQDLKEAKHYIFSCVKIKEQSYTIIKDRKVYRRNV